MNVDPAISTGPQRTRPASYADYLNSPEWRKRRDTKLRAAHWRCERCESKLDLQVHHKSYQRLGAELDTDLEVLCQSCHEGHHHRESASEHIGRYVLLAADVVQQGQQFETETELIDALKFKCAQAHIPYNTARLIRAAQIVIGKRRGIRAPAPIQAALERGEAVAPPSRSEAEDILRQLNIKVGLRSIPKAKPDHPFVADKLKAMQMVAQEITESIARCEALEQRVRDEEKAHE